MARPLHDVSVQSVQLHEHSYCYPGGLLAEVVPQERGAVCPGRERPFPVLPTPRLSKLAPPALPESVVLEPVLPGTLTHGQPQHAPGGVHLLTRPGVDQVPLAVRASQRPGLRLRVSPIEDAPGR